eukprot:TRINITY_DN7731_c0_g1_i2.p1 TRINITY_DN7731_c0_g1~~TRINITY_DN7731_c0_g1_i2.p1  ORF type:complete len:884 (+),score=129.38 TRINITY_DN7731_c0_g1_i2:2202-4853(+)
MAVPLRLLLAGFTSMVIVLTSVLVGVIALLSMGRSNDSLVSSVSESIARFADTLMNGHCQQMTIVLKQYFDTLVHLSQQQRNMMLRFGTNLTRDNCAAMTDMFRCTVNALPETAGAAAILTDGTGAAAVLSPRGYTIIRGILLNNQTFMRVAQMNSNLSVDPVDLNAGMQVPADMRQQSFYSSAKQRHAEGDTDPRWAQLFAAGVVADGVLTLAWPFVNLDGSFLGAGLLSPSLTWISTFLRNITKPTGSVAFLVGSDGRQFGASHGRSINNSRTPYEMQLPVPTNSSTDARVREGYTLCLTQGKSQATIDGVVYLCGTQYLMDEFGLSLTLVVLTPRAFFFDRLDQSVQDANKNTRNSWKLAAGLCAAVLVVGVVAVLVLSTLIAQPLSRLTASLVLVAELRLDSAAAGLNRGASSLYAEVQQIHDQFLVMSARLAEYKAFLPATVVADPDTPSSRGTGAGAGGTEFEVSSGGEFNSTERDLPPSTPLQLEPQRRSLGTRDRTNSLFFSVRPAGGDEHSSPVLPISNPLTGRSKEKEKEKDADAPKSESLRRLSNAVRSLELGLAPRTATCVVADTDGFHSRVLATLAPCTSTAGSVIGSTERLRAAVRLHGLYIEHLQQCVQRHSGSLDGFRGDHLFASWNTFVARSQHCVLACKAALDMKAAMATINEMFTRTHEWAALHSVADSDMTELCPPLTIRAGVATGRVSYGRVGCETLRSTAVSGPTAVLADRLAKHAKLCGGAVILADHRVFQSAKDAAFFRPADIVTAQSVMATAETADTEAGAGPPRLVYELVREHQLVNDEWMYVYDEQEKAREREPLRLAFAALLRKDFAAAQTALVECDASPGCHQPYPRRRVRSMVSSCSLQPVFVGCVCTTGRKN